MFTAVSGRPRALQDLLVAVSVAEALCGRTERGRVDGVVPPVAWLSPSDWLPVLDDGTPELRLAASVALASVETPGERIVGNRFGTLRTLLRPIEVVARGADQFGRVQWTRGEAPIGGLGARPVTNVLADALVARSEAARTPDVERGDGPAGVEPWFGVVRWAGRGDVEALASGAVDMARFADLIGAMLLLQPNPRRSYSWQEHMEPPSPALPAWRILAPFFVRPRDRDEKVEQLRPASTWARQLANGGVENVLESALLRWTVRGLQPVYGRRSMPVVARGVDGTALAAALLCAPSPADVARAVRTVVDPETTSKGEEP